MDAGGTRPRAHGTGGGAGAGAVRALPAPPPRRRPDFSLATVNIVLLLVLFFLVAGSIVSEEERVVDLPETLSLPLENLPRPLLVIGAEGTLAYEGTAVADRAALMAVLTEAAPPRVYVMAARDLPANALVQTVAGLAGEGIEVSLVTVREGPAPGATPDAGQGAGQGATPEAVP